MKRNLHKLLICFFFFLIIAGPSFAQEKVTGKVVDAVTKEGLPGASVTIEGTTLGTTTNVDGEFSLETKSASIKLVINYIGYKQKELVFNPKGTRNLGDIALEATTTSMSEIVVSASSVAIDRKTPVAVSSISSQQLHSGKSRKSGISGIIKIYSWCLCY